MEKWIESGVGGRWSPCVSSSTSRSMLSSSGCSSSSLMESRCCTGWSNQISALVFSPWVHISKDLTWRDSSCPVRNTPNPLPGVRANTAAKSLFTAALTSSSSSIVKESVCDTTGSTLARFSSWRIFCVRRMHL